MADTTLYTHFDIDRYLNKKMTKQEMHDFEKAMMEDPFLADAFEGYQKSDHNVASLHLAEIEKQLTVKEEKAKVVAMPSQKTAWWKIAAVMVLLAGISGITYRLLNNQVEPMEVAANKQTTLPLNQTADSIGPEQKPAVAPQLFPYHKEETLAQTKGTSPVIVTPRYDDMASASTEILQNNRDSLVAVADHSTTMLSDKKEELEAASATPAPQARSMAMSKAANTEERERLVQNEFKGRVTDPAGEPLGFAAIYDNKSVATVADANGNFSLKAADSVLEVEVAVVGYSTARAKIKSGPAPNNIKLPESDMSLDEVVVTAYARKKKNAATFGKNAAINKGSGVEPVKGWNQFQQYIFENVQNLKDTSATYIDGDVVLEFDVDDKGHPKAIKVAEANNKVNADKAIEFLQNGPKWKRSNKNKKGKVIVSF